MYINRFSTTDNGGITFTGNTLGLSKLTNQNQPGLADAAGAFITTDVSQQVGLYLPGTTLLWQQNSSSAILDLPLESTVLYAELIWSGSYGFNNQITGNEPNASVTLITPQNNSFSIAPDPTTSQTALTPGFTNAGNYVRSANVTSIIQAGGKGEYTVGGIPATISSQDNSHNAAGWTLAVVYRNPFMLTYNMTIFVGCEQASSTTNSPAPVSGFCVPPSGLKLGSLYISAIEGDANITGDHMLFGSTLPLTIASNSLSGGNNPLNNFFASQINTLSSFSNTVIPSKLVGFSFGGLDTRGSFGSFNANALAGTNIIAGRQGYDITCVDISETLNYNQTTAFALGTTTGDDYTINALGMQILVGSPIITATKTVNGVSQIYAEIGDIVTFAFEFGNVGTRIALNLLFQDLLETGLMYVPGSFFFNNVLQPDPNLNAGFAMGNLAVNQTATITFQAQVVSYPASGSIVQNEATINYDFEPCQGGTINLLASTNQVELILSTEDEPIIEITKAVNSSQFIMASLGDTITYSFNLQNIGEGAALNVIFKDVIPSGQTVVPNSVLLNGVVVSPDPDLAVGFSVGNIIEGQSETVEFQVVLNTPPPIGNLYFDTSTADYQYQPDPRIFVDLSSNSNTVTVGLRLAPQNFTGILKKCKALNKTTYCLSASWQEPVSGNVLFYRIYHNGILVKQVPAGAPLIYSECFGSKKKASGFEISTVFLGNIESTKNQLSLKYE